MRTLPWIPLIFAVFAGGCGPSTPSPQTITTKPTSSHPIRSNRPVAAPLKDGSSDGMTCEEVMDSNVDEVAIGKKQEADLRAEELSSILNQGAYLSECDVPEDAKLSVCAAVKEGRAMGVTIAMQPSNPDLERCVAGKVRALGFPIHPKLHVARTTFE